MPFSVRRGSVEGTESSLTMLEPMRKYAAKQTARLPTYFFNHILPSSLINEPSLCRGFQGEHVMRSAYN